jgi:hypothetical protein
VTWFGTWILLLDDSDDTTELYRLAGLDVDRRFSLISSEPDEPILISHTCRLPWKMAAALLGLGKSFESSAQNQFFLHFKKCFCDSNETQYSYKNENNAFFNFKRQYHEQTKSVRILVRFLKQKYFLLL